MTGSGQCLRSSFIAQKERGTSEMRYEFPGDALSIRASLKKFADVIFSSRAIELPLLGHRAKLDLVECLKSGGPLDQA